MTKYYPIYRKIQSPSKVLIVHKRRGRERMRSAWEIENNCKGRWGAMCRSNFSYSVNTSTKWEEVTCLRCLQKGEIYYGYTPTAEQLRK